MTRRQQRTEYTKTQAANVAAARGTAQRCAGLALAALIAAGCSGPTAERGGGIAGESATAVRSLPYEREYPGIAYASSEPQGRLGTFAARVAAGDVSLRYDGDQGYLESVLAALGIDPSSQALVFSRTSLQVRQIRPETPRAIYFNDDTYVAFIPGAPSLELSGFDPALGPVFFSLIQDGGAEASPEREQGVCLRCHDTYGLSGGGVPRFLLGSGYIGTDGELVSHEAWILTSQATSLRNRWGGWYVTGRHGSQVHLGNIIVERPEDLQDLESLRVGNLENLDGLLDTSQYLTPYSDIVALLVLEHQIEVQNLLSRLRYETLGPPADAPLPIDARIAPHVEALVRAMLMQDAIAFTDTITGSSGFAERFETLGPFDASGRSLRELDLETRLFRYPLSYLIYSDAFQALPAIAKSAVYARLRELLAGSPAVDGFDRVSPGDRESVESILRDTLPEVFETGAARAGA